ncbi:MAG: LuxR C-terminal-related transcriptional regulator [Treponema sp.]|jgi:LuxR family maltose regulon positive regulatory protein|nr:LuxR C-terminal-related transcriptional regulator [Treponema sp.]
MSEQLLDGTSADPGERRFLDRPRIDCLLEEAVRNPVVFVSAGAGYGKTHAVYSFVLDYPAKTGWIQLSQRDNFSARFWKNFIAGLSQVNKKAAERLALTDFPETERQFEHCLAVPLDALDDGTKYIFVYDDFHLIHNKAVLHFIERFTGALSPNNTSIFISRFESSINLIKYLSKGLLGGITEEDLRFSKEEMTEYFRIQNINLSFQDISSIYHDTDGWAFAIQMADLFLKNAYPERSSDPSGQGSPPKQRYRPHAIRSNIFNLIESEIMSGLPSAQQKFLIKLSLTEHLTPQLLEAVAGEKTQAAGKPLMGGMKKTLPLIRFDAYINKYRIHHLFLEYLSNRQSELAEEEKREVYREAAKWCAQNNQELDAVFNHERAGDYEKIIAMTNALPLVLSDHYAQYLLRIFDRIPPDIYKKTPTLYAVRARILISLTMFDRCEKELETLMPRLEALPPEPGLHWVLMALYADLGLIGIINSTYTKNYSFTAHFERAAWHINQCGGPVLRPPVSVINIGSYICRVNTPEKEETDRYIGALAKVTPHAAMLGGCGLGIAVLARAELAFFKGDMMEAEQYSLQALYQARKGEQYEIENRALFFLLRIGLAKGNFEKILQMFKQLEAQLCMVHYINRYIYHDIVFGWFYTQTGQTEKIAPWIKDDFEESDLNSMDHGLEILVKAKYHFAEKEYPAALASLENQKSKYDSGDFVMGQIEVKTLEAVCYYQLHNRAAAFAALETAYRLSEPNDLYMPFVELGKNMRALVTAALKGKATEIPPAWLTRTRLGASNYAKKLFKIAQKSHLPVSAANAGAKQDSGIQKVHLSRRERDVLVCLSQGMTQDEIADEHSLSMNTVKSVIRSIYNKLGAINKADAVRIAAGMDLLK